MPAAQDGLLRVSLARIDALETTVAALQAEVAELREQNKRSTASTCSGRPEPCTESILRARLRERGAWISGDYRIGESDLAWLLGQHPDSVRNLRRTGTGPPSFRVGGHGHQVTYRIADIARWLDRRREI